ncbi:MAG: lysophospholipase [Lachnospiraceae bacterium]|nr:lysophospholipase [Lachnospiraceae bacterium]
MDFTGRNSKEGADSAFHEISGQIEILIKKEQRQKIENYKFLNQYAPKRQILFTGSSLMEQFPISELCLSHGIRKAVYNRGIGGYTTDDFLEEIDTVLFDLEPSKVFINIGTNDIKQWPAGRDWMIHLLKNYEIILRMSKERLPHTRMYLMAYYPVNAQLSDMQPFAEQMLKVRTNENIRRVNQHMAELAKEFGYDFINVNQGLTDENNNLKEEYTIEGVHMYANAYWVIFQNLKQYL